MSARPVFIVAGEKSGDIYGAALVKSFRARRPDVPFFGVGGTAMEEAGVERIVPMDDLAKDYIANLADMAAKVRKAIGD
jgi:lipid-A-disaccharide synthase